MNYLLAAFIVCGVLFACPKKFSKSDPSITYLHSRKRGVYVHLPPDSDPYAKWPLGALAGDWLRYNAQWHCWKPAPMYYFKGYIEVSSEDSIIKIINSSVAWGCWVRPLTMVDFDFIAAVRSDESAVKYNGDTSMYVDWHGPGSAQTKGQNQAMDAKPRS
ncbi:hypothetical protein K239x_24580 [Planctomycetes bacterium K23_9]|uniref:Uncharacterized protein n=2 Tax=Stieleria marina TaxID=1930275 RepID=A0A517NTQ2_9BACT|nr:hypothetical protein K239x_24580 [Planctomycetes bacterium K23_9]